MTQMHLIEQIESVVQKVAYRQFGPVVNNTRQITRSIQDLSDYYTSDPSARGHCPDRHSHRAARLIFFTMADMLKSLVSVREFHALVGERDRKSIRVLDVGAGYGAQSLGLIAYFAGLECTTPIHIDLVDRDRNALDTLASVLEALRDEDIVPALSWSRHRRDLNRGTNLKDSYDLIVSGSTYCELSPAGHRSLTLQLLAALRDDGALFIIEPALKKTARQLHALRDSLLEKDLCQIVVPCTHQNRCPCLASKADWCHESRPLKLPPECGRLAATAGLRRSNVKWSYMTLARSPLESLAHGAFPWRVVSEPMPQKGRHEVFVCGPEGRFRAVLPRKEETTGNCLLKSLDRGQVAALGTAEFGKDRIKLNRESVVDSTDRGLG